MILLVDHYSQQPYVFSLSPLPSPPRKDLKSPIPQFRSESYPRLIIEVLERLLRTIPVNLVLRLVLPRDQLALATPCTFISYLSTDFLEFSFYEDRLIGLVDHILDFWCQIVIEVFRWRPKDE